MTPFKRLLTMSAIRAFGILPLSVGRMFGSIAGRVMWAANDRSAKITIKNLELCFPNMEDLERKRLAKRSLQESGKFLFETLVIYSRSNEWLSSTVKKIYGQEIADKASAEGKGLVILCPHIGNWEVPSHEFREFGEITAMYLPPKQKFLEKFMVNSREKNKVTLVPASIKGVARLIGAMRRNGVTVVLPDQCPKTGGVYAPLFGVPAYTMTMVSGLLQKSEAKVLGAVTLRVRGGFELHYLEVSDDVYSKNKSVSARAINKLVEDSIHLCPEQYTWEYKRFKGRNRHECPYRNEGMAPPGKELMEEGLSGLPAPEGRGK